MHNYLWGRCTFYLVLIDTQNFFLRKTTVIEPL